MFKNNFNGKSSLTPATARSFGILLAFAIYAAGCGTIPMPSVNLSEPGWTTRQGQAVWRAKRDAPEIAGDLMVATNPDGRSFLQFTKTPLPFVVAQSTADAWRIQFVPYNKTYSGRGVPPQKLIWLYLPRCLAGLPPPEPLTWRSLQNNGWHLENRNTGEFLESYLTP